MKIAFLTPEYPHPKTGSAGGIGTSIMNLAKGLHNQGHTVTILVYKQDKDTFFEQAGISIYKIKNVKVKGLSLFLTQRKVTRLINKLVYEGKIDIIEAPDWTGFTSLVFPKCPLVIRLNGSDTYFCHLEERQVKYRNRWLEKTALLRADGIISVSEFTGKLTQKLFQLHKKFTVIPNSIDLNNFEPSVIQAKNNTILYFGTLIRKKGLLELPLIFNEIIKKQPDAKLILVGKDSGDKQSGSPSTWKLMQPLFTSEAFKNTEYYGVVPYSEIKQHIAQATVCVFPTFAEALPVSWIEAMALEKAIVASSIGWAPEVIDDGVNGYLGHPKNHDQFAFRILKLLKEEPLRKKMGAEARKKVIQKFSINKVAEQSVQFYKEILKEK
jgi:glycosyltransferase involved in cell wall biosynthesis